MAQIHTPCLGIFGARPFWRQLPERAVDDRDLPGAVAARATAVCRARREPERALKAWLKSDIRASARA